MFRLAAMDLSLLRHKLLPLKYPTSQDFRAMPRQSGLRLANRRVECRLEDRWNPIKKVMGMTSFGCLPDEITRVPGFFKGHANLSRVIGRKRSARGRRKPRQREARRLWYLLLVRGEVTLHNGRVSKIIHLSPTHGKVACLAQPSKLYASRCNARLYPKPFASAWVFKMKGATFGFNEELAS